MKQHLLPPRSDLTADELADVRDVHPVRRPLRASVALPGSKEDTNRALILGAISDGDVHLHNVSLADDSLELMAALRSLGVQVSLDERHCTVSGTGGRFAEFSSTLQAGVSGTSSRFLAALCLLVPGTFSLDCGPRMRERPMGDLLEAMSSLGAHLTCSGVVNHLPVRFENATDAVVAGGSLTMQGANSSQFCSALLLVAGRLRGGLEIEVIGKQVSQSYIDMTQASLSKFGIEMLNDDYHRYVVPESPVIALDDYEVESDATAATYFLALAAITGGTVRVTGISPASVQGDARFAHILELMGCRVSHSLSERWIEVSGPEQLTSCNVDMLSSPDAAQTLAVVAAFANGRSLITGLSTLRFKETDRLDALHRELSRMGVGVRTSDDWIEVEGGQPHGSTIKTYGDHRMAMSFAIAGAAVDGVRIAGAHTVSKSFPEFWETLTRAGVTSGSMRLTD